MTTEVMDMSKLEGLLEQERAFLLEGNLDGLGTLLPAKERLMDVLLEDLDANRTKILPLEGQLKRNQLLLDGALDGIRAVSDRLAALRQVKTALDTYDAQGRKQSIVTQAKPKVERRA
jgi:hypothetical protein